jgi:hypothetical protein
VSYSRTGGSPPVKLTSRDGTCSRTSPYAVETVCSSWILREFGNASAYVAAGLLVVVDFGMAALPPPVSTGSGSRVSLNLVRLR